MIYSPKSPHFGHKAKAYILAHRVMSGMAAVVVVGLGYWTLSPAASTATQTRYVLGEVSKSTIVASLSASGQVATSQQIDIKPKVSGEVVWVGVKPGDTVRAGQALVVLDNTDAKRTFLDTEQSYAQASLQYQKDSAQAPIDYQKATEALDAAKADLVTTYNDTFNAVSTTFLNLPTAVTGMYNILYGYDLNTNKSQWNIDGFKGLFTDPAQKSSVESFADAAEADYKLAQPKYDASLDMYKKLTRYADGTSLEKLLASAIESTTAVSQALQSEINMLDMIETYSKQNNRQVVSSVASMQTNARSYLSTANTQLSSLLSRQKTLDTTKKAIRDNERSIQILTIANPSGDKPISLQAAGQNLASQARSLEKARQDLANYTVVAPFAGKIASVNAEKFNTVGSGTAVATLITNKQVASLSLSEVDVAKIQLGDKATLTFDAIDELSLTGAVTQIDLVGTVSQGVVNYKVQITFDIDDTRVKPGMTVNASIVTDVKQDVLTVPSTAVKVRNGASYVLVFDPALADVARSDSAAGGAATQGIVPVVEPKQVTVVVGISNDTETEIISGLKEGQQIVARTIAGTAVKTAAQTAPSLFGTGGGAARAVGGGR
ncbi:MAG: HlyD family efflux transporter periplasmic adaptor subunit [bacterium]